MTQTKETVQMPKWVSYPVLASVGDFYTVFEAVRRVALHTLRKSGCADAEDLAQDVVLDALQHVEEDPHYFDTRPVAAWARRSARYAANHWQRARDAAESNDACFELERATEQQERTDPHRLAERSELRQRLDCALAQLDPKHRALVLAVYVDGESYEEAADRLGVSEGAIGRYLHNARAALRRALETPLTPPDDEAEI